MLAADCIYCKDAIKPIIFTSIFYQHKAIYVDNVCGI